MLGKESIQFCLTTTMYYFPLVKEQSDRSVSLIQVSSDTFTRTFEEDPEKFHYITYRFHRFH